MSLAGRLAHRRRADPGRFCSARSPAHGVLSRLWRPRRKDHADPRISADSTLSCYEHSSRDVWSQAADARVERPSGTRHRRRLFPGTGTTGGACVPAASGYVSYMDSPEGRREEGPCSRLSRARPSRSLGREGVASRGRIVRPFRSPLSRGSRPRPGLPSDASGGCSVLDVQQIGRIGRPRELLAGSPPGRAWRSGVV
jgi:hypothetical protein